MSFEQLTHEMRMNPEFQINDERCVLKSMSPAQLSLLGWLLLQETVTVSSTADDQPSKRKLRSLVAEVSKRSRTV